MKGQNGSRSGSMRVLPFFDVKSDCTPIGVGWRSNPPAIRLTGRSWGGSAELSRPYRSLTYVVRLDHHGDRRRVKLPGPIMIEQMRQRLMDMVEAAGQN